MVYEWKCWVSLTVCRWRDTRPAPCAGDGEGVAGHITLVSGGAGTMVLGDTIVRAAWREPELLSSDAGAEIDTNNWVLIGTTPRIMILDPGHHQHSAQAGMIQWHWLDPPSTKLRMKNVNSYLFFASRNICVWGQMWGIEWKMLPEKEVKFLKPKLTHFCPLPSSQINIFSIYNDAALYSSLPLLSSTTTKIFLPILVNKLDFCRRKMLPI